MVAWGPFLLHCTSAWSGLLWPSVWPTVHTTWLAVSNGVAVRPHQLLLIQ